MEHTPENPAARTAEPIYSFDPPRRETRKKGILIWVFIILGILLLGLLIGVAGCNIIGGQEPAKPASPYVAVLYVEGTITSDNRDSWGRPYGYQHQFTLEQVDELINDENNKAIMLFVDSPGGGVYESDELYFKLKEYKESTGRPVYSYMGSMAASGGYYVSAPADKIFANRNCWTGSIGVTIGTLFDVSGLLERYGVKSVTIASGPNKAMGSMTDPLTKEQEEIFRSLVEDSYLQFVNIVAEERELDLASVMLIADGRIYTARQALDLALIDGIGSFDDAMADLAETYGLEDCLVYDIVYTDDSLFGTLFSSLSLPSLPKGDAAAILSLVESDVEFPVSYLCEALN